MRTLLITLSGGLLTVVGALLLVLPGPGFVLIAAGLTVLATRYEWARTPLQLARRRAEAGIEEVRRSPSRRALAIAAAAALLITGGAVVAGVTVPLVGTVSAVLLIVSGVFLFGTIAYAVRRT